MFLDNFRTCEVPLGQTERWTFHSFTDRNILGERTAILIENCPKPVFLPRETWPNPCKEVRVACRAVRSFNTACFPTDLASQ